MRLVYADNNATTQVAPEVVEAMQPFLADVYFNPSSMYEPARRASDAIGRSRAEIARRIGTQEKEIIFTSCATESNNAAIHAALKANPKKKHIITSTVEHSSVLNYCMALEKEGYRVTYLPVDREGLLKLADLENAITDVTAIVHRPDSSLCQKAILQTAWN